MSRNKKNNVYPCKPQFYYIKGGFKGVKFIYACFRDAMYRHNSVFISPLKQGASNAYPQHMFLWRNKKTTNIFFQLKTALSGAMIHDNNNKINNNNKPGIVDLMDISIFMNNK